MDGSWQLYLTYVFFFFKIYVCFKTGWQLVAAVTEKAAEEGFLGKWMVAGSFCPDKAFFLQKSICSLKLVGSWQLMLKKLILVKKSSEKWMVAGSCCSGSWSNYMVTLKNGWQLVAFALTNLFFKIYVCFKNGWQLVAYILAIVPAKRVPWKFDGSWQLVKFCSLARINVFFFFKNSMVAGSCTYSNKSK